MLGPLFSALAVARGRLKSMLDAAKIRVCTVMNTGAADCLLFAMLAGLPYQKLIDFYLLDRAKKRKNS